MRGRSMVAGLLGGVALLLAASGASALTMDEAVRIAQQNNHQIREYSHLEDSSLAGVEVARSVFYPEVYAEYEYETTDREDPLFEGKDSSFLRLSASYNLYRGGSDAASLEARQADARAAGFRRDRVLAQIALEAKEAYIAVLLATRAVETAAEGVTLLERQQRDTALYLKAGLIARNELLRVEVELATARRDLLQNQGLHQVAKYRLARVMGVRLDEEEIFEDFSGLPALDAEDFDALEREMLAARSELKTLYAEKEALEHRVDRVNSDYRPSVDVELAHTEYGDTPAPMGNDPLERKSSATLSATWNLYRGDATRHEAAVLVYRVRANEAQTADLELDLRLSLQTGLEAYRVARENLRIAEIAVEQAEENYRVTENRVRQQQGTTVDLLDARFFLTRAKNERLTSYYNVYRSVAAVERILERTR